MPTKRQPDHSETVRSALLHAAAAQFLERGYEATTVRDIAQAAQVTTGSLYHFFGNKEGVFEHLIRDVFRTTTQMADAATADHPSPYARLCFELAMQIELISQDARLASLYHAAHASASISRLILQLAQARMALLLRDTPGGTSPSAKQDHTAYRLAVAAKSTLMGLTQERLLNNQLTTEQRLDLLIRVLWGMWPASRPDLEPFIDDMRDLLAAHRAGLQSLLSP